MKDQMFNELIASVREGAIPPGEVEPSGSLCMKEPDTGNSVFVSREDAFRNIGHGSGSGKRKFK